MSNYPPSICANDPRAPWNEPEGECSMCGDPCDTDICPTCNANMLADLKENFEL